MQIVSSHLSHAHARYFASEAASSTEKTAKKKRDDKAPAGASTPKAALTPDLIFVPNRYSLYYDGILHRELMLKLGSRRLSSIPRLTSITLTIKAESDTKMGKEQVPKLDLLLHLLALEILSGSPASFLAAKSGQGQSGRAEGVYVTLTGDLMMTFLEKLVHLVLPNMIGFEGISSFQEVPPKRPPRPGAKPVRLKPDSTNSYYSDLRISSLLLFPDFERNFDLFEPLGSCQVRLEVDQCTGPDVAALLLSGFSIPVKNNVNPS
jgi:hypothetical protein